MYHHIFDSHSHYTDEAFREDAEALLTAFPTQGVERVLLAACDVADSKATLALAEKFPYVYGSAGVHPEQAPEVESDYLEKIAQLAKHPKCKAIGEIGLDYHYEGYDAPLQKKIFREQLALAKDLDLPVIIHARDCTADYLEIIKEMRPQGVVHCFSGSAETAEEVLKLGMYIGFTGVLTFKNAKKAHRALAVVPRDRLLMETDCPYMAPVPMRGKRCDSTMIAYTAQAAAEVLGMDTQELLDQTMENAKRLFRID